MSDGRKNLPSASGIERIKLCRGSFLMEQQYVPLEVSEVAETGTLIHNCLAGITDPKVLDESERWTYEQCKDYEGDTVRQYFNFQPERINAAVRYSEQRLYLYDEEKNLVSSGQVDVMYIDKEKNACLVIDYKTGWKAVTDPVSNMQLRAYAVLAWQNYGVKSVRVAVVQPNTRPVMTNCDYTEEDLIRSYKQILRILAEAKVEGAPLTPGPKQCEYCKAKSLCPALAEYALTNTDQFKRAKEIILMSDAQLDAREKALPGEELAKLLDSIGMLTKWAEALKAEAKTRLKVGRSVKGYGLRDGAAKRAVTKPYEFYEQMKEFFNPRDILQLAKFPIGKVEELFQVTRAKTKKEAAETVNTLFYDVINKIPSEERQLTRIEEE